jgi:hypothetical protein
VDIDGINGMHMEIIENAIIVENGNLKEVKKIINIVGIND